jgi:hypothetical protein
MDKKAIGFDVQLGKKAEMPPSLTKPAPTTSEVGLIPELIGRIL